jgi:predicted NBD/HSP70 family sugar kinase
MHRQTEDRCIASIDIGGTTTKVGVVSSSGVWSGQTREFPTPAKGDPDSFLSMMIRELERIQTEGVQISGIGVAVPGVLSVDGEVVEECPNTPVLVGYPFRTALKQRFGMPATLEVDCNAAALGEHAFGAGRDVKRLLVISLGTGAGASLLINGEPLRFTGGCCGDLGHVYVGGELRCSAGCKGCLESEVSVRGLGGSAQAVHGLIVDALQGKVCSIERLHRAGRYIGRAVASLGPCFQPDLVLLAGGIAEAGHLLTESATEACAEYCAPCFQAPIQKAALGAAAALAGAAVALLREMDRTSDLGL